MGLNIFRLGILCREISPQRRLCSGTPIDKCRLAPKGGDVAADMGRIDSLERRSRKRMIDIGAYVYMLLLPSL
jgi:hypothetical protein